MATEEIACVRIHPCTTDERLKVVAEEGDIAALYESVRENPELLKEFEDTQTHCSFKDTPLHIAAAYGHTALVTELMILQPTMARKLNQDGLSPMHIALKEGHTETVLMMLEIDKDLFNVKGKNGHTTLHYLFIEGEKIEYPLRLLTKLIEKYPRSVFDVTNRKETVLHLAARINDDKAFRFLLFWLWSDNATSEIKRLLNATNIDGDTVLHMAAYNNQKEILKLATEYFVIINLKTTNSKNLTALKIAKSQDNEECAAILRRTKLWLRFFSPLVLGVEVTQLFVDKVRSMNDNSCNALLVVATLILTATYQAALSPPGGEWIRSFWGPVLLVLLKVKILPTN